ncbi:SRPBCC family protein [Chitinophaga vietnamensis]|uniref:SRPBCC family protein n=1 Tax=Chitinophaga vietnamensis TaxID=2593957 RepID=UPI0011774C47|nr:SRPBCC domain-containing protein [Chitinophaga vietnamensis]
MTKEPLVVERVYHVPVSKVWQAITDNAQMKQWYFQIADFKAEVGFEFEFTAGDKNKQYVHHCKVTEVVPGQKLSYTWRYRDYPGDSLVTFELFPEGNGTRLKLSHYGLESFPGATDPAFAPTSFNEGWNSILGVSLKKFLEG